MTSSTPAPAPVQRPPLVAVSLKAYLGAAATADWLTGVRDLAAGGAATDGAEGAGAAVELAVLPSFPLVPVAARILEGTAVAWGAQDVAPSDAGAQTGEVTAPLLAELGCRYAVVGHAERRARFGDTDEVVRAKVGRLAAAGVVPLLCVGETERVPAQEAADVAAAQLADALAGSGATDVVVGYEPVWAIGAPKPAGPDHVVAVADRLHAALAELGVPGRVVYGGAAGPGTLTALAPAVDGVFLGRFAHDVAALGEVLAEARRLGAAVPR
ncbi:triose-phosphate isomerase family protein [Puerhibacterium puerhi]|uniref:triose-phosphate isomerase family protein n=1 Tax=Puerhibacterium puerhi TaxID=2692623 RepID=UPI00135A957B|nr:triose-phosphate isomerase family protein [Puerhibacterium puerhi]